MSPRTRRETKPLNGMNHASSGKLPTSREKRIVGELTKERSSFWTKATKLKRFVNAYRSTAT